MNMIEASTCMSLAISISISMACVLIVTLLLLSWKVLNWVWFNPKRLEKMLRNQGFQGNTYRLLYGDTKDMSKMEDEARSKPMSHLSNHHLPRSFAFLHHTLKNYGKKSFMWQGTTLVVNITEPKQIREILMNVYGFKKPQVNPIINVISPGLSRLEGKTWAKRRKLLNPAFHIQKLKLMLDALSLSSSEMVQNWEKLCSVTGSCELNVWLDLRKLSADVISRAAFGSSFEEGRIIFELITEQIKVARPSFRSPYIPGWRFVPTKLNRRVMQIDFEIKRLLKGLINKRVKAIKAGEKPKDDLLGILLDSSFKGDGLKLNEVINECKIFYLAGQATTSSLLSWTLILLGKHQDWQKRARDEVLDTFGYNNTPDFNRLNTLKTVTMILQEVLRLYPAVAEIQRIASKEIKIGDIIIPAGVVVSMLTLHVQQDKEIWGDDAKEFNPGRFNEGISSACGGNMSFFSFGWGPRNCIGSNFAMTTAKTALVLILQRFSFELSPSYQHAPAPVEGLLPQFGAQIILHRLYH